MRVLAATLQLEAEGDTSIKGADLWDWLRRHEDRGPSAATVYRALRRLTLEHGLYVAREEADSYLGGKPRVYYALTDAGRAAAQQAQIALADRKEAEGINWLRLRPVD
jgi:DNA-binding PadR family transcriptional regulator